PLEKTPTSLAQPGCGTIDCGRRPVMSELSIIQGPYLQDILGQPQALQDTLLGLDTSKPLNRLVTRLRRGSYQRIVLTGMGGSFHALYPATLELVDHGFNAIRVET